MTWDEKVSIFLVSPRFVILTKLQNSLTYGIMTAPNSCVGNIPAITRLGFPGMCLHDAGNGVRATDFVNGYPASISLGSRYVSCSSLLDKRSDLNASWNKDLVSKISGAMAGEFKKKGVHVALAPSVGPLGRLATGGRNWEGNKNTRRKVEVMLLTLQGFGSDPYIAGVLAAVTIEAIHERGVMTSTKVSTTRIPLNDDIDSFPALDRERARNHEKRWIHCRRRAPRQRIIKYRRQNHA